MGDRVEYPNSRAPELTGTVWDYFSRCSLIPRKDAPADFQAGFNESLYTLRNRSIVGIVVALTLPAVFILTPPPQPSTNFTIGASVQIGVYLGLAIMFSVPQVRHAAFNGKYSHWIATTVVVIPYIIVAPFLAAQSDPYSLATSKRTIFLVLYIIYAMILHAHALAVLVVHTALVVECIVSLKGLEEDHTNFAVSSTLLALTAALLYAAFYYSGFARCQSFLARVQAVQTKSGAAASTINNSFIRQVLHDFGTPLSTLTLGIGEFSTSGLTARQKVSLEEIRLACWHLHALRDRAMQFAVDPLRFALPRMKLTEIDLKDFLNNILRPLVQVYGKIFQQVRFVMDVQPNVPRWIETEPDWLLDIMLNLLDNAFRYTVEGTVTLEITYQTTKNQIVYKVKDTGPGVTDEERQTIFHPFYQGRAGLAARHGNGLGLWSVYMKVKALGGICNVKDNEPHGVAVVVCLPVKYATDALSLTYDVEFLAPVEAPQILEPTTQENLLGDRSSSGHSAANGTLLEDRPRSGSQPDDSHVAIELGEAVPPSSVPEELPAEHAPLLGRTLSPNVAPCDEGRSPHVLVVEDQMVVRRLFKKALERCHVIVDEAENGVQGLAKMKAKEYDCVFSDIWMPEMNGDEMAAAFRAWEATARQSRQCIIAVSAVDTSEAEQQVLSAGIDGFLRKPVDIEAAIKSIPPHTARQPSRPTALSPQSPSTEDRAI